MNYNSNVSGAAAQSLPIEILAISREPTWPTRGAKVTWTIQFRGVPRALTFTTSEILRYRRVHKKVLRETGIDLGPLTENNWAVKMQDALGVMNAAANNATA